MSKPVYSAGGFASKEEALKAAKQKIDELIAKEEAAKKLKPQ